MFDKLKRIAFSALVVFIIFTSLGWAQQGGGKNTCASLKILVGSRESALSGSIISAADSVAGACLNVAGLAQLTKKEIAFTHNNWLLGINHDFIGYAHPLEKDVVVGASLIVLSAKVEGCGIDLSPHTFYASDIIVSAAYAKRFQNLCFGVASKGIFIKIDDEEASTFALDFGLIYQMPKEDLPAFGISVANVGPVFKFERLQEKLPLMIRCGLSQYLLSKRLLFALAVTKEVYGEFGFCGGVEGCLSEYFALRCGFDSRIGEGDKFSVGAGFKVNGVFLDYSFVPYGKLGYTHRVSFAVRFD